jgi:hypothetical protein
VKIQTQLKIQKLIVLGEEIEFDTDGIASVSVEIAEVLLQVPGYAPVIEKPAPAAPAAPAAPKKAAEKKAEKKPAKKKAAKKKAPAKKKKTKRK